MIEIDRFENLYIAHRDGVFVGIVLFLPEHAGRNGSPLLAGGPSGYRRNRNLPPKSGRRRKRGPDHLRCTPVTKKQHFVPALKVWA